MVEFWEERRGVDLYATIEEVKRVIGSPPKRIFGNMQSVGVEVETKEQSGMIVEVEQLDNIPRQVKERPKVQFYKGNDLCKSSVSKTQKSLNKF